MSLQFRRILCPVTFDDNSLMALDFAVEMARIHSGTVYLMHVARIPTADMDAPVAIPLDPHWEQAARLKLGELIRQRVGKRVSCVPIVTSGIPESSILCESTDRDIDLIVMASHGRAGFAHLVLGSVAEEVVRLAPCPVLVVKAKGKEKRA